MQNEIIKALKAHEAKFEGYKGPLPVSTRYLCNFLFQHPDAIFMPGEHYMRITRRELHRMKMAGLVEHPTPALWQLKKETV